ncbi:MAG TPA: dipeptidase [Longimicrobiales bacterium]|nr:dipeptidase [Longimicrobiales bacterium]
MRYAVLLPLVFLGACSTASTQSVTDRSDPLAHARALLSTTMLVDGHNDLPWAVRQYDAAPHDVVAYDLRSRTPGHTDIERLREGMVGAQFWSVYIPINAVEEGAAKTQLEQIDIAHQIIQRYPDVFELALTTADAERVFESGRIASMLGMEGGHAIENSLGALRSFYDLGVRYMTLTHSANIDWADSCCALRELGGLSEFGREVVREMNRLGMLVDLSHVSGESMHDALDVTEAPVIFSHSSARGVTEHPRNVPDDVLQRLPENGGVVMVTFVPSFINTEVLEWSQLPPATRSETPEPQATIADVIRHIEHVRDVAGIDHVGIGADFDGIDSTPVGLEDVSTYPALFAELIRRGWSDADLRKLAGENVMRVWRESERVAARLRQQRPASTATIEGLDGG